MEGAEEYLKRLAWVSEMELLGADQAAEGKVVSAVSEAAELFIPLGDLVGTVTTLIQGSPHVNFTFDHQTEKGSVHLSCAELREVLGDEISLAEPEILSWIDGYLREQYQSLDS